MKINKGRLSIISQQLLTEIFGRCWSILLFCDQQESATFKLFFSSFSPSSTLSSYLQTSPGAQDLKLINDIVSTAFPSSTQSAHKPYSSHQKEALGFFSSKPLISQMAQRRDAVCQGHKAQCTKVLCGHLSMGIKRIIAPFIEHLLNVRSCARHLYLLHDSNPLE